MFSSIAELINTLRRRGAKKAARPRRRPVSRRRVCLQIEGLEQRDVPTVAFMPNFTGQTITGSLTDGMKDPPVVLFFSGNFWSTQAGQQDMATFRSSASNIMSGPYLSGLTQYGSDGKAFLMESVSTVSTVTIATSGPNAGTADPDKLQDFLNSAINNGLFGPGDNDWQHAPIYFVISDPASSKGSFAGWNDDGHYERTFWDYENIHMAWLSTALGADGHVTKDNFTDLFSHELVETLSDPDSNGINIVPPSTLPMNLRATGNLQIADDEPDGGRYMYRLGDPVKGDLVQAYWSNKDQAFIVPDNNSQLVLLRPIWNNGTFSQTFGLEASGDQLGYHFGDKMVLDVTANGNVTLNLNQQRFTFEVGKIAKISLDTVGGANTVQVNAVPAGVSTLTIQGDDGTDAVTLGNGSLVGINPTTAITVQNIFGQTSLYLSGYQGPAAKVTLGIRSIVYNGLTITYNSALTGSGKVGVTAVEINAANGSSIDAESIPAYTTMTVDVGWSDPVYGPAANQLAVHRRLKIYYPPVAYVGTTTLNAVYI